MKVKELGVKKILDSRGEATIEVSLASENGDFFAKIPSGKSRGKKEAVVLNPFNAEKVLRKIVSPKIVGRDFGSISELDRELLNLDGTENKEKIGGNLILGISITFARALAALKKLELWEVLRNEFFDGLDSPPPVILSNLINGGAHAKNNLDIQEYLVIVDTSESLRAAIGELTEFYQVLKSNLSDHAKIFFGDEGGYAPSLENNEEPILIMADLIRRRGLQKNFRLGLDAAASDFYKKDSYWFGSESITSSRLSEIYAGYFNKSKLMSYLEDPFAETDYDGFKDLLSKFPDKLIVGDDLTVTNSKLIEKFFNDKSINSVIIKPNQIGTLTESCEAMQTANRLGMKTIVSHRSGETDDAFLIHIARAGGAYGVKIGAPKQPERLAKFDELLRIYS